MLNNPTRDIFALAFRQQAKYNKLLSCNSTCPQNPVYYKWYINRFSVGCSIDYINYTKIIH